MAAAPHFKAPRSGLCYGLRNASVLFFLSVSEEHWKLAATDGRFIRARGSRARPTMHCLLSTLLCKNTEVEQSSPDSLPPDLNGTFIRRHTQV